MSRAETEVTLCSVIRSALFCVLTAGPAAHASLAHESDSEERITYIPRTFNTDTSHSQV